MADALNDYIILSESSQYYVDKMEEKNSSVAQKIKEKKYLNKAYIRFFQASVYDAIRRYIEMCIRDSCNCFALYYFF